MEWKGVAIVQIAQTLFNPLGKSINGIEIKITEVSLEKEIWSCNPVVLSGHTADILCPPWLATQCHHNPTY